MSLMFAVKLLCDLCFFMFAVSSIASKMPHTGLMLTSPLIIGVSAYISRKIAEKCPQKSWLRFVPVVICSLCFIFTKETSDKVLAVTMILYLIYVLWRGSPNVGYDMSLSRFFLCLKLIPAPMFLMILANNWTGFKEVMLPYFFFFFVLSVMMLRMLRHNDKVLTDNRFRIINVTEMALVCGVGYLLSSGLMMKLLRFLGSLAITYIAKPILTGIMYIFGGFAWLLNKIFTGVDFKMEEMDFSGLNQLSESLGTGDMGEMEEITQTDDTASVIMTYVLIGAAAIIIILVIVLLFRALARAGKREDLQQFADSREAIDPSEIPGSEKLTRSPRDKVRNYYRKFLKLCSSRGCTPEENSNTREINSQVRHVFRTQALPDLRDVYIRARYSTVEITQTDVQTAKDAYDNLKKS